MATADLHESLDLPSDDPPPNSPVGLSDYLPWLVVIGLVISALGYTWRLAGDDWGISSSTDTFNASWACSQYFLALAGYGVARLLAEKSVVMKSWCRFVFFGLTGFLLLMGLAWMAYFRAELLIERRIHGPVFNLSTGSSAMQAVGLCLAVVGMIVTYVVAGRTPKATVAR